MKYLFIYFTYVLRCGPFRIFLFLCVLGRTPFSDSFVFALLMQYHVFGQSDVTWSINLPVVNWWSTSVLVTRESYLVRWFMEFLFSNTGVPAFRDFWFQWPWVIMKCGDHEFRGLFLVQNPKMGPKWVQKGSKMGPKVFKNSLFEP